MGTEVLLSIRVFLFKLQLEKSFPWKVLFNHTWMEIEKYFHTTAKRLNEGEFF